MKKTLVLATVFALAFTGLSVAPASAGPAIQEAKWGSTPVAAGQASYGKACQRLNSIARAKGADGSNLVCKVETEGSYKGKRVWAYAKYPVLRELNFKLGAGPTSGYAGFANEVALALKAEKLVRGNIVNESVIGGSGSAALNAFQLQDRGKAGKALVTGYAMILGTYNNKNAFRVSDTVGVARLMAEWEAIAVPADSPFKTIKDLMDALKADPTMPVAGGSIGTLDHFTIIQVLQAGGIDSKKLNYVPHSGGGEVVTSLLSGATKVGISGLIDFEKFVKSGDLRILGISAPTKQAGLPYETFRAQGVNVVAQNWRGIMLPPGTSRTNRDLVIRAMDVMRAGTTWQGAITRNFWGDNFVTGSEWDRFLKREEIKVITLSARLGL